MFLKNFVLFVFVEQQQRYEKFRISICVVNFYVFRFSSKNKIFFAFFLRIQLVFVLHQIIQTFFCMESVPNIQNQLDIHL